MPPVRGLAVNTLRGGRVVYTMRPILSSSVAEIFPNTTPGLRDSGTLKSVQSKSPYLLYGTHTLD